LENHVDDIHLMDGALEFIGDLKDSGYQLGLATSTNWSIVDRVFDSLNLHDIFDSVTTGEEVDNPKPFPDIYLVAAEKLGVDPADCLVIEDSTPGVTAAVEAKMKVIAISDNDDEKEELDNANLVVENFSKITAKVIDLI
jgi:HAD superfamily hydrolase (TIGR01509 family)